MQNIMKYSNGKRTILCLSDTEAEILMNADNKFQIVSDELLRMENEGGIPLTPKQTAKISTYAKARKRIKALLFSKESHQNPNILEE